MFDRPDFLNNSLNWVRMIISYKVEANDAVVDATCGNGNDTLFLAGLVKESGKIYAFDVQQEAVNNTRKLLLENNCLDQVELICDGHQNIDSYVKEKVKLVLFNLGYLPGADKSISTKCETTLEAVEKSLLLLDSYGLVLLVLYSGHEKGVIEKEKIIEYAKNLTQKEYNVFFMDLINQANNPPVLLGIERKT